MQPLPEPLRAGPFTLQDAERAGLSPEALTRRPVLRLWRGAYAAAETPDSLVMRCRALQLRLAPEAVFSHTTALALHGLRVPHGTGASPLHVSVPRGTTVPAHPGVRGHDALLTPDDVTVVQGLRTATPARAWAELAGAGASVEDLVVVADGLLHRYGTAGLYDLEAQERRWEGRRYVTRLREARALTELHVDSAPESVVRVRFIAAGLPRPRVNFTVLGPHGAWLHRADLAWPEFRVAYDYDGAPHLTGDPERHARDMGRFEPLAREGWILRVVTAKDLRGGSRLLVHSARQLLLDRGATL